MNENKDVKSAARRAFMKKAGLGAGAVGAVAIGLPGKTAQAKLATGEAPGRDGYRETEHVKRFYETARF